MGELQLRKRIVSLEPKIPTSWYNASVRVISEGNGSLACLKDIHDSMKDPNSPPNLGSGLVQTGNVEGSYFALEILAYSKWGKPFSRKDNLGAVTIVPWSEIFKHVPESEIVPNMGLMITPREIHDEFRRGHKINILVPASVQAIMLPEGRGIVDPKTGMVVHADESSMSGEIGWIDRRTTGKNHLCALKAHLSFGPGRLGYTIDASDSIETTSRTGSAYPVFDVLDSGRVIVEGLNYGMITDIRKGEIITEIAHLTEGYIAALNAKIESVLQ